LTLFWIFEAKDDESGGDSWSYKTCEAPVRLADALHVTELTASEH